MTWQWLKDSQNNFSYARVIGAICIITNLIWRLYMGVGDINNLWQAVVACSGFLTGIALWLVELFRENKQVSVKFGGKEFGAKIGLSTDAVSYHNDNGSE